MMEPLKNARIDYEMVIQEKARIIDHRQLTPSYLKLTLKSKYISSHAQPGQFVNIRVSEKTDPLLRRPLSVHRIDPNKELFELLYEVVGQGTALLSQAKVGDELDVLGPLGNGFKMDKEKPIAVLIAGGMGIAPLRALAEEALKTKKAVYVFIGGRSLDCIQCESELKELGCQVLVSTDDGSSGKKGLVTDLLEDFLMNQVKPHDIENLSLYACGPQAMLRTLATLALEHKVDCQVSMEEKMACGIGACLGCAVETIDGYKMVCKDGPVFNTKEIKW